MFKVQTHVLQFENICKTLKNNLCCIENDDAINCTMKVPNTYWKIVFTQFNKEHYKIIIFPTNY